MDFSRQCKRFLNYNIYSSKNFGKNLSNISAVSVFRVGPPASAFRLIIADNDEKCLCLLNESDGQLLKELPITYTTYSLCCTTKSAQNHIYVSDYDHSLIRKYDENLNEIKNIRINELSGPCGIAINNELKQLQVIDQNNNRILFLDLNTEELVGEFKLFQEDLEHSVKHVQPIAHDLSVRINFDDHIDSVKKRVELDFRPFGLCNRNERFYVTDWQRGHVYIYKNNVLEKKCSNKKLFRRPRDLILDSVGNIIVTDVDRNSMFVLDNKGTFLFETKVPKFKGRHEKGIFGIVAVPNSNRLIFASNTSLYLLDLVG